MQWPSWRRTVQSDPKVGTSLLCFLNQLTVPVETDAKVKLEENGFCVFTEFLDTAELEKVEQNLAR